MQSLREGDGISKIVEALSKGKIVAFPTETFYALGVDAHNPEALKALSNLKSRPIDQPFPVFLPSMESLSKYATDIPAQALSLAQKYWPGPLTLILKCEVLPKSLQGKHGGVGFRISQHPLAQALASIFKRCITSTSANPSGCSPASSAEELGQYFQNTDILILDGGKTPGGKASTVIDFTSPKGPTLVREGRILKSEIETILKRPLANG